MPLTWESIAKKGWTPTQAAHHRGCTKATAERKLRLARRDLRITIIRSGNKARLYREGKELTI